MDQHDRDGSRIARAKVKHVEYRAGDLDRAALRGITALDDKDSGLCDPGQEQQRYDDEAREDHPENECPVLVSSGARHDPPPLPGSLWKTLAATLSTLSPPCGQLGPVRFHTTVTGTSI